MPEALLLAWSLTGCVCTCPQGAQSAVSGSQVSGAARSARAAAPIEQAAALNPEAASPPELIEDEIASEEEPAPAPSQVQPHPLARLSDSELLSRLKNDLGGLGSMTVGLPNKGAVLNSIPLKPDPRWIVVDPSHAYGTEETVQYVARAIDRVFQQHADTPPLHVGHISGPKGGFLSPHRSHQSGRDVDLGYYYNGGGRWYLKADQVSLDVERSWALVRALITETDVRFILIDQSIQPLLRSYAESIGEDRVWLEDVFSGRKGKTPALIRHAPGHRTHMHVRFYNPIAQETARRCYPGLIELKLVRAPVHFLEHRVKKGDTLISLAKRYGTSVRAIKRANRLRSNKIFARKSYKIPRTGPASAGTPVSVPARRLPPEPNPLPEPVL